MATPLKLMMATAGAGGEGGTLWAWGRNDSYGQLGIGDVVNRSSPTQVGEETNWTVAATGDNTNQYLNADGEVYGSGLNNHGNFADGTITSKSAPTQMIAKATWVDIYIGGYGGVAVADDGTLWTWGENGQGQLGLPALPLNTEASSPLQVGSLTDWAKCSGCQNSYTMIKTDGTLWGMGNNNAGQLGDGTVINRSSPVQIGSLTTWGSIPSTTAAHRFAIKTDDSLWVYGDGGQGRMGHNSGTSRSSPVQVTGSWQSVSGGSDFSVGIKTDGTLWTWGYSIQGQGGRPDKLTYSSPVQVGSLTSWSACAAIDQAGFAIKTDGTMWSWGINGNGVLGQPPVLSRSSPVQIGSLTSWSSLAKSCSSHAMAAIQGG